MDSVISVEVVNDDTVEREVEQEVQRTVPEDFSVRDSATAAWVVRRVLQARDYMAKVKMWAEAEERRAEAEEKRLLFLFGSQLRRWTEQEIEKLKGRRRSIALPSGVVGLRAVQPRLIVVEEGTALAWAKASCPAAVVITEKLLKTPIIEHFDQTGEVPPGTEVTPAETAFYIR